MKRIEEFESEISEELAHLFKFQGGEDAIFPATDNNKLAYGSGYRQGALESSITRKLESALEKTLRVVESWHGPLAWDIYLSKSPEMKPYREALAELALLRSGESEK